MAILMGKPLILSIGHLDRGFSGTTRNRCLLQHYFDIAQLPTEVLQGFYQGTKPLGCRIESLSVSASLTSLRLAH